jgi:hypothetical protein
MTATDRATRHVVDRCPSCGVEHDVRMHACEACDTPLRPWCRVHGGEMGWLTGPACPRCAEDAARYTWPPRPRPPAVPMKAAAPAKTPAKPSLWPGRTRPAAVRTPEWAVMPVMDEPLLRLSS